MIAPSALLPPARIALAAAVLTAAALMWSLLPTKLQSWAPIEVHGTVGERITGRNLAVTVHDTYLAHEVTFAGRHGLNRLTSKGIWLAIVLTYEPLLDPQEPRFELNADGRAFALNLSGFRSTEQPGMPSTGPVTFELPAIPRSATLLVANQLSDTVAATMRAPLDSLIAVPLPLADRTPAASLNLNELSRG